MYNRKTYVHKQFRATLTCLHHTSSDVGHPGQVKTIELISRNYWWPTLFTDVKHFVWTCPDCQKTKIYPAKLSGLLQPNPIVEAPWKEISADFITRLPDSHGYIAIMVVVDQFTKMVNTIPTNDTVNSDGMARLYCDNVWKLHGLPDCIIYQTEGCNLHQGSPETSTKLWGLWQPYWRRATPKQMDRQSKWIRT